MSLKAKQDQMRQQLNLKNLQRHDPTIKEIVTSASYASVYENFGEEWVKTGVEGPMFLFSRTEIPHYGFFILNRQGLEYIQEFLTPECELNVGGEFILFESGQNVDKATGIWIFNETERASLCKRMEQLRSAATAVASSESTPAPPSRPPAAEKAHAGQSISLDMLFGSSPTSTVSPVPSKAHETTSQQAPANPLDLLFLNAARNSPQIQSRQPPSQQEDQARSKPPPQPQQQISGIPKTLEQLFAAASPIPQSASLPFQSLSQAHLSAPSPRMLPNPLPKSSASSANGSGQGNNASPGMSLLDAIFASASTGNGSPVTQTISKSRPNSDSQPSSTAHSQLPTPSILPSPDTLTTSLNTSSLDSLAGPQEPDHLSQRSSAVQPAVTTHPAPFHLNESILNGDTPQGGPPKEAESRKPVFSAPLLSHNVFAGLPLPSSKSKKESKAEDEIPGASVGVEGEKNEKEYGTEKEADERERQIKQEERDLNIAMSKTEESISEILRSANSPLPSITPTQSALHPHTTTNGSSPSLASLKQSPTTTKSSPRLLPKSELVDLLDSTISQHGKNGTGGAEPLEKEEFLKNLLELLEKPSVQMQLYGKYLERVEEQEER
ncbi:hypothetical protein JCM5353_005740 [Sporobolomyces roseus]